jgi:hypothetical protein
MIELIQKAIALLDESPEIQTVDWIRRRDRLIREILVRLLRLNREPRLFS